MKIASINIQRAKKIDDAQVLLNDVSLSEKDFPWLEDVRTLLLPKLLIGWDSNWKNKN